MVIKRSWPLVLAMLSLAGMLGAADAPRTSGGEPVVGKVRSASALIGRNILDKAGVATGQVADLLVDLGRGGVVSVIATSEQANTNTIPIARLEWNQAGALVVDGNGATPAEVADPQSKSQLVRFTSIENTTVNDARGHKLGHIIDLALAEEKGLIAFVVFKNDQAGSIEPASPC